MPSPPITLTTTASAARHSVYPAARTSIAVTVVTTVVCPLG